MGGWGGGRKGKVVVKVTDFHRYCDYGYLIGFFLFFY